ncbi:hypothetical protein AXK11_01375 [Cephaloticoccus primus]|uniref:Xylose isomerase-like TIM barrel domain-containing protein n=2 Tax=Cephaloticoccus primus TaxID=1548207 RepID=A0A139SU85_9BACT|nr:hypothetical protein AXK11_01375 [Cephaloticoccus primus]
MLLSMQLFSTHRFQNYVQFIKNLGEMGYDAVEGYPANFEDRHNIRAALDGAGMTMPTVHMGLPMLEDEFDTALGICRDLGVKTIYVPGYDTSKFKTVADWSAFARRLGEVGKRVQDAGFGYGWHNHTDEFKRLEDGRYIMEVLLDEAPNIEWQADIAWVDKGGADPLELTGKYSNRVTALHFRELTQHSESAGPLGRLLDWDAYFAPERNSKIKLIVVEHEAQPTAESLYRFAKELADTYKTIKTKS